MFITLCTIRQLPQAFALGDSLRQHAPARTDEPEPFVIGLLDDSSRLPTDFRSPYPLLPVATWMPADELAILSARYTPTELAGACKPRFIETVFTQYPPVASVIYVDPNVGFFGSTTRIDDRLAGANALLTPHITRVPADNRWPDEKAFQNVGLYSADFLAFRRSNETSRLLTWWRDRVEPRAAIDFCAGTCTDQLWLMHVPVFFRGVSVVKDSGWHVALWNLPERSLRTDGAGWRVDGPTGEDQPLLFANFKGLHQPNEGFFPHQNRLRLNTRPDAVALLNAYRQALRSHAHPGLTHVTPAYGERPEPAVLRGWRGSVVRSLQTVTRWVDQVPLPVVR